MARLPTAAPASTTGSSGSFKHPLLSPPLLLANSISSSPPSGQSLLVSSIAVAPTSLSAARTPSGDEQFYFAPHCGTFSQNLLWSRFPISLRPFAHFGSAPSCFAQPHGRSINFAAVRSSTPTVRVRLWPSSSVIILSLALFASTLYSPFTASFRSTRLFLRRLPSNHKKCPGIH